MVRAIARPRDTEIDHLGVGDRTVHQNDVVGGKVAMDHALAVRRIHAARDAGGHGGRFGLAQRARAKNVAQRRPVHELHGEVVEPVRLVVTEHVVAHDRGVIEPPQRQRLAAKQRDHALIVRHGGADDLDGNGIVGLNVMTAIDLRHAA